MKPIENQNALRTAENRGHRRERDAAPVAAWTGSSAIGIGGWPDGAGRVRHVRKLHHRVASAKQRAVCRAARKGTQRVRLASVRERRLEQRWPDDLGEEN